MKVCEFQWPVNGLCNGKVSLSGQQELLWLSFNGLLTASVMESGAATKRNFNKEGFQWPVNGLCNGKPKWKSSPKQEPKEFQWPVNGLCNGKCGAWLGLP